MTFETWQDYWTQNGYGLTTGKPTSGGGKTFMGTLDPGHAFNPNSTSKRYKLPGNAAPIWNEAGNIDPAVLTEWAQATGVDIKVAAGATEQQDVKYVANASGNTWYGDVLRPWTIAREQQSGGGAKPVKPVDETGGDLGVVSNQVLELHGRVDELGDSIEEMVSDLGEKLDLLTAEMKLIKKDLAAARKKAAAGK